MFHAAIFVGSVFFGPTSRALVVITWRGVGMPLHDAVGINCENGATIENQGSGVTYIGYGVCLDDCVCVCVI